MSRIAIIGGHGKVALQLSRLLADAGAGPDHGIAPDEGFFAYADAKAAADAHLRRSALAWTILEPGRLTDDPPSGHVDAGVDAGDDTPTSRGNVALVAAAALAAPSTVGRTLDFIDGATPIGAFIDQTVTAPR